MQGVVELHDLRAQIGPFGDDLLQCGKIGIEPLRQRKQLGHRRVGAVKLLQSLQGVGQIAALTRDRCGDVLLITRRPGIDQSSRGGRDLSGNGRELDDVSHDRHLPISKIL